MTDHLICVECGREIPANSPGEQCPACLMRAGLRDETLSFHPEGSQSGRIGDSMPVAPAKQLSMGDEFGGYKIVRRLGRGGMGIVYEADQLETGRRVALKVLARSLDSTEARKRFLREGRLAASINHPNSVYVFGTDEVEDIPIISMELVRGGTLAEQVAKNGPLSVPRAVDAILQVIDGLQAAREKGVLHRDVKPANCFIEPDGTVKIGDFGLSISTGPRDDVSQTEITFAGQVLGTPAFASPEQLRGGELDIRSDIYSVAVTLFYLLTGDTPFRGKNLVQLLATVLEQTAPRVDQLRPDVPKGVANVIARCLHKLPEQRFRDYESLRQELLPFSTTAPTPALLGLRTLANMIDIALLSILSSAFTLLVYPGVVPVIDMQAPNTLPFLIGSCIVTGFRIFYYGVAESLWGASLGKAALRLRVIDGGGSSPSLGRSLERAAVFVIVPSLYSFFTGIVLAGASFAELSTAPSLIFSLLNGPMHLILFLTLFSTARRSNGYAGIHDWVGGVTVVSRQRETGRLPWHVADVPLPQLETLPKIGPFAVLDRLSTGLSTELLLAYDTRLLRRVWVHRRCDDTVQVSEAIRNISRPGRLRWLANGADGDCVWDAYEAPRGVALAEALGEHPEWSSIRYWLSDLADELRIAKAEGTLPARLSLDRLWVGSDGRLKLLDIAAPGTNNDSPDVRTVSTATEQDERCAQFIADVSRFATAPMKCRERKHPLLLPMSARGAIEKLDELTSLDVISQRLQDLLRDVPAVTRKRRFGLLFCCIAFSLSTAVSLMMTGLVMNWQRNDANPVLSPAVHELSNAAAMLEASNSEEVREQIRTWISGYHRETLRSPEAWGKFTSLVTNPATVNELQGLANAPMPTDEKLREADVVVRPAVELMAAENPRVVMMLSQGSLPEIYSIQSMPGMMALVWLEFVWIPSVITALLFRGGLLLRLLNLVAVRRDGKRASSLRMLWRALAPAPLAFLLGFIGIVQMEGGSFLPAMAPVLSWLTLLLIVALLLISAWHPQRSISDRLAGTYLVPR